MNDIKINEYRVLDNGNEKPFCVYLVEARINGRTHVVEKRYSQFHALHGDLRKSFSTPYFPPKKVRSLQPKVLEKRRQALETYLQTMLKFTQSRAQILSFLGINKTDNDQMDAADINKSRRKKTEHQPIFQFKEDFPSSSRKSTIPDIITEGVLMALYNSP